MSEISFCSLCQGSIPSRARGQFFDHFGQALCESCHASLDRAPEQPNARALAITVVVLLAILGASVFLPWARVAGIDVILLKWPIGRIVLLGSVLAAAVFVTSMVSRRSLAWANRSAVAWGTFAALFLWTLCALLTLVDVGGDGGKNWVASLIGPILLPALGLIGAGAVAICVCIVARRLAFSTEHRDRSVIRADLRYAHAVGASLFGILFLVMVVDRMTTSQMTGPPAVLAFSAWPVVMLVPLLAIGLVREQPSRVLKNRPRTGIALAVSIVIGLLAWDHADWLATTWRRAFSSPPAPIPSRPATPPPAAPPPRREAPERPRSSPPAQPTPVPSPSVPEASTTPAIAVQVSQKATIDLDKQRIDAALDRARKAAKSGELATAKAAFAEALAIRPDIVVEEEQGIVTRRLAAKSLGEEVSTDRSGAKTAELLQKWEADSPNFPISPERDEARRRIEKAAVAFLEQSASRPSPDLRRVYETHLRLFEKVTSEQEATVANALRRLPIELDTTFSLEGDIEGLKLDSFLVPTSKGLAVHKTSNPEALITLDLVKMTATVETQDPKRLMAWDRVVEVQPGQLTPRLKTASALQLDMGTTAPPVARFNSQVRLVANRLAVFGNEAFLNAGRWKKVGELNSGRAEWADSLIGASVLTEDQCRVRTFPNDANEVTIVWVEDARKGRVAYGRVHLTERRPVQVRQLTLFAGGKGLLLPFEVVPYKGRFTLLAVMDDGITRLLTFDETNGFREAASGSKIESNSMLGNPGFADLNGDGKREYVAIERAADGSMSLRVIALE